MNVSGTSFADTKRINFLWEEKKRERPLCVLVLAWVCEREKGHLCAFVHACTCVCVCT